MLTVVSFYSCWCQGLSMSFSRFSRYLSLSRLYFDSLFKRYGTKNGDQNKHLFNIPSVTFTEIGRLNYCILLTRNSKGVLTKFELFSHLNVHKPTSIGRLSLCKTRLFDLRCGYPYLQGFLSWRRIHHQTIKFLKTRGDIYIAKPDKVSVVVVMDKQDYIGTFLALLGVK